MLGGYGKGLPSFHVSNFLLCPLYVAPLGKALSASHFHSPPSPLCWASRNQSLSCILASRMTDLIHPCWVRVPLSSCCSDSSHPNKTCFGNLSGCMRATWPSHMRVCFLIMLSIGVHPAALYSISCVTLCSRMSLIPIPNPILIAKFCTFASCRIWLCVHGLVLQ